MNEDLDLIRRSCPPTDGPDRPLVERERNALMAIIEASRTEPTEADRRPRRRRITWMVPAAAAVVSLTAAAAWATLRSEPAPEVHAFSCVSDEVDAGLGNEGLDPVEACKSQWESGSMKQGVTEAPPLVACVWSGGTIVVIEGADGQACEQAGMAVWAGGDDFTAVGDAVRDVRIALYDRAVATGNRCATEADWRDQLAPALASRDLAAWTIESNQVEPDRQCYDVGSIRPSDHIVEIIGVPGDDSGICDPRTSC